MSSQGSDGSSGAPAKAGRKDSPKHCLECGVLVKEHSGPHGKDRCLVGTLKDLQLRVQSLEGELKTRSQFHTEELARLNALHDQRVDGLLASLEELQEQVNDLRSATTS